jgi:CMP/dCMP kinase
MIITLSGIPGSGKSTIGKALSKKLKFKYYSMGMIRRDIAKKKGLTLEQYNKLGETNPSTDTSVDEYQVKLAKKEDNIILEGRTSFYFVPQSVKLFIDISINEAAKRILKDLKDKKKNKLRNEGNAKNIKEMKQLILKRISSDKKRYNKYYKIKNAYDKKQFDIIINTTNLSKKEALSLTIKKIDLFLKRNKSFNKKLTTTFIK